MDNKEKLLVKAKLAEKGFMPISEDSFIEELYPDSRVVAIIGKGAEKEIFVVGHEKLEEMGSSYKDCYDDIPEIKLYNQRLPSDEMNLSIESSELILEKHKKIMNSISNKPNSKTDRTVNMKFTDDEGNAQNLNRKRRKYS